MDAAGQAQDQPRDQRLLQNGADSAPDSNQSHTPPVLFAPPTAIDPPALRPFRPASTATLAGSSSRSSRSSRNMPPSLSFHHTLSFSDPSTSPDLSSSQSSSQSQPHSSSPSPVPSPIPTPPPSSGNSQARPTHSGVNEMRTPSSMTLASDGTPPRSRASAQDQQRASNRSGSGHSFSSSSARKPHSPRPSSSTSSRDLHIKSAALPLNPALLSRVAAQFRLRVPLSTHTTATGVRYHLCFRGCDAVDVLAALLRSPDRNLALLVGRALDAQRFFHHVAFEHRLRDSANELYAFPAAAPPPPKSAPSANGPTTGVKHSASDSSLNTTASLVVGTASSSLSSPTSTPHPTGFFTLLSTCYSPTCTSDRLCYSVLCPRQFAQRAALGLPQPSTLVDPLPPPPLADPDDADDGTRCWSAIVPDSILHSTPAGEIKRQEAIFELIVSEESYVDDLVLIERMFMDPIIREPLVPSRPRDFCRAVFGNVSEVREASKRLAAALVRRQQEAFVVKRIGDVVRAMVPQLRLPLVKYAVLHPWGKYHLEAEVAYNPKLARYLKEAERAPQARRLPIQSFLGRPITRAARYSLLLHSIAKATPASHPDMHDLDAAMSELKSLLTDINAAAGKSDNAVRLLQLHQAFAYKSPAEAAELDLQHPERQLLREGVLKRGPSTGSNGGGAAAVNGSGAGGAGVGMSSATGSDGRTGEEMSMFLLDHAVVLARRKRAKADPVHGFEYRVYRTVIPLDLLVVDVSEDQQGSRRPPTSLGRGVSDSALVLGGSTGMLATATMVAAGVAHTAPRPMTATASTPLLIDSTTATTRSTDHSFTITRRGRAAFSLTLVASSQADRRGWLDALRSAHQSHVVPKSRFRITPVPEAAGLALDARPNGSAWLPMPPGETRRLLVATDRGVYALGDGRVDKIVQLDKPATQVSVVADQALVLVLAADRTLWGMALAAVVHRALVGEVDGRGGRVNAYKLASGVGMFRLGAAGEGVGAGQAGRTWVCTAKPSGLSSTFKVYEPVLVRKKQGVVGGAGGGGANGSGGGSGTLAKLFGFGNKPSVNGAVGDGGADTPDGFTTALRLVRELYVPAESLSLHVIDGKLFVGCGRGFEILDPETASIASLLDPDDPELEFIHEGEGSGIRPLAVFPISPVVSSATTLSRSGSGMASPAGFPSPQPAHGGPLGEYHLGGFDLADMDTPRYLLCYAGFALFLTADGRRARPDWWIEWDGEPKHFSLVGLYVIAYSSRMIEIWHLETAQRVQILPCESLLVLDSRPDALVCAVPIACAPALMAATAGGGDWDPAVVMGRGSSAHFLFQLAAKVPASPT